MEVDSWITITILVNFIALIFQVGAFISPMWYWLQSSSVYTGIGLWYAVGSSATGTTVVTNNAVYEEGSFVALRVLQSVGTAGILVLVVLLIVYKVGYTGKWSTMDNMNIVNTVAFILCLFTVLVLLASAAVFGAYYWSYFRLYNDLPDVDRSSIPWSSLMSLLAAIILILVCVFIRVNCRPEVFKGTHIPMSGDAKFDLHPHVQNGNANRYYNQTPYIDDRFTHEEHRQYVRGYDDYDDRRNGAPGNYEHRSTYVNRIFEVEPDNGVFYTKPTSREFRENRDRELGHTIYTAGGFSYMKGEVNRSDDVRYTRQVAPLDYSSRLDRNDEYYDHLRSSSRQRGELSSSSRAFPPSSNIYIYRPFNN